jgi:hypothetical protein
MRGPAGAGGGRRLARAWQAVFFMAKNKQSRGHEAGMGTRGIVRPMALHQASQHEGGMGAPGSERRQEMARMHHERTQWVRWTLLLLGLWMIVSPLTFSPAVAVVEPSGGRELWLSLSTRIALMRGSDILSGVALLALSWRFLKPNRPVSGWAVCAVGIWLTFAPLLFWAPTAAAYLNDTFVGAWVIALSILVPGMPNMMMYMEKGAEQPPGWSYNPSSWMQRSVLIALGFAGWLVSRYLAAYQLGYVTSTWDPFFGESARRVLDSTMSKRLPVSDAGLGSLAYTFEFLMGFMGSPARWRTMPWMVALFGVLVIPLGMTHIFLVISQPVLVGEWCTFCLAAAAIMLPMIPLEVDEVIAMGQFLRRAVKRGESFWKYFWKGGSDAEDRQGGSDERSPAMLTLAEEPRSALAASLWGMSAPWNLIATTVLGVGITFIPALFGIGKPVSDFVHVGGLLAITCSVLAMGETIRLVRSINLVLGAGLALLPLFFEGPTGLWIATTLSGVALVALSVPRGTILESYGSWEKLIH